MSVLLRASWLLTLLVLLSCVTVNIYFPVAAAEKIADQIISDVWQDIDNKNITPKNNDESKKNVDDGANLKIDNDNFLQTGARKLLLALLDRISVEARAQNVDFNASSPTIERLKATMSQRFTQMHAHFDSGGIGLTDDGYVAVRDASLIAMAQRAKVNQLVQAENADRKALYTAIAAANKQPNWVTQIQQTFAKRWISQAQSGWWYLQNGSWKQK